MSAASCHSSNQPDAGRCYGLCAFRFAKTKSRWVGIWRYQIARSVGLVEWSVQRLGNVLGSRFWLRRVLCDSFGDRAPRMESIDSAGARSACGPCASEALAWLTDRPNMTRLHRSF